MTVVAVEPGHAWCAWRGERRRVATALVGDCVVGEQLLVFLDSARERLDAARAAEIDATLALLARAWTGDAADGDAAPGFALPSAMSFDEVSALASVRTHPAADLEPGSSR